MAVSTADRLRAHREAFILARELDCTPAEAAHELRRREARQRSDDLYARLQAKRYAPLRPRFTEIDAEPTEPRDDERWMMRN